MQRFFRITAVLHHLVSMAAMLLKPALTGSFEEMGRRSSYPEPQQ
jgi:hypothetical protein